MKFVIDPEKIVIVSGKNPFDIEAWMNKDRWNSKEAAFIMSDINPENIPSDLDLKKDPEKIFNSLRKGDGIKGSKVAGLNKILQHFKRLFPENEEFSPKEWVQVCFDEGEGPEPPA